MISICVVKPGEKVALVGSFSDIECLIQKTAYGGGETGGPELGMAESELLCRLRDAQKVENAQLFEHFLNEQGYTKEEQSRIMSVAISMRRS